MRTLSVVEPLEIRQLLTVLTFSPVSADGATLPAAYGDRVTATTQNGFTYSTSGGVTPNVRIDYGPIATNVRQAGAGYGDLTNVAFAGVAANGILDAVLTADLGHQVTLDSFDLASAGNADRTINSIRVTDAVGNVLFTRTNQSIQGDNTGARHSAFSIGAVSARVLRIHIDASSLGANSDKIGIDNIAFHETNTTDSDGDGYPDVVLGYRDTGAGGINGPYGGDEINGAPRSVSIAAVLGDDEAPSTDYVSLPTGSYVTLGFADETIVDGPGNDLVVREFVDTGERAKVYITKDLIHYDLVGIARAGRANKFDLASIGFTGRGIAVKIVGLDANGASPGFDLSNVQILPGSMERHQFRFPLGDGIAAPAVSAAFGSTSGSNAGLLGEDYATSVGRNVFSMGLGTVSEAGSNSALGTFITIEHTLMDGTQIVSVYGHLSKTLVKIGQAVTSDTKIGFTGNTGNVSSASLYFGIWQEGPALAGSNYLGTSFSSSLTTKLDSAGRSFYRPSAFIGQRLFKNILSAKTAGTLLTVTGSEVADSVSFGETDTAMTVTRNGVTRAFDSTAIARIEVTTTAGNDLVNIGDDVMGIYVNGGDGDDTLIGGDGNDTLSGGGGRNLLTGNGGDDRLNGANGRDSLTGGAGNDRLYGNGSADTLDGGDGIDRLFGGLANDLLIGGSSNDKLYGEDGNDTLNGGKGNDILDGGPGTDLAIRDLGDTLVGIEG